MVKFGKKYRQKKLKVWESKYINYKHLKHFIKINSTNLNNEDNSSSKTSITKQFVNELDKEFKTFFFFFTSQERDLYVKINKQLHANATYYSLSPEEISNEINTLYKIALTTLDFTNYIHLNLIALSKILKKFDKKFKQFNVSLSRDYIVSNLKQKNSDLFYIFEFKLIDEVLVLLDDLQTEISSAFKVIKNRFKKDNSQEQDTLLLRSQPTVYVIEKNINDKRRSIMDLISEIEKKYVQISQFHRTWNRYFKLSDYTIINKTSTDIENVDTMISAELENIFNKRKRATTKLSKENRTNLILTLIQKIYMAVCFMFILPNTYSIILDDFSHRKPSEYYSTLVLSMTPLGGLFSIFLTSFFISKTFKVPMLIASALCVLGNILFTIGIIFDSIILFCFSRLLVGLSLNINIHRLYVLEFVPKKHIANYMLAFKLCNYLGYALGPLITYLFTFLGTSEKRQGSYISEFFLFDQYTAPSWILSLGSVFVLTAVAFCYVEPVNHTFNAYGDGESPSLAAQKMGLFTLEGVFTTEELESLNQINNNLNNLQDSYNLDETNLVANSIIKIVSKERSFGGAINKALSLVLYIVFITNFIIMSLLVNTPLYIRFFINLNTPTSIREEFTYKNQTISLMMLISFLSITLTYVIHFFYISPFVNKSWYMLIISLLILISEIILRFGSFIESLYVKLCLILVALIFSFLLTDTAIYFYTKFVPSDAVFCKVKASTFVIFISMMGMFCGSIVGMFGFILQKINKEFIDEFNWIIVSHFILICLGILGITLIGLSFRDKAIRRIIRKKDTQKLRRTEF